MFKIPIYVQSFNAWLQIFEAPREELNYFHYIQYRKAALKTIITTRL